MKPQRTKNGAELLKRAVVSAEEAFDLLDIDRSTGYKAIREGTFPVPVLRIGRTIRIPTVPLRRLLEMSEDGIPYDTGNED
jgi:predicted DNA-binding transcriptional regulator AlpA